MLLVYLHLWQFCRRLQQLLWWCRNHRQCYLLLIPSTSYVAAELCAIVVVIATHLVCSRHFRCLLGNFRSFLLCLFWGPSSSIPAQRSPVRSNVSRQPQRSPQPLSLSSHQLTACRPSAQVVHFFADVAIACWCYDDLLVIMSVGSIIMLLLWNRRTSLVVVDLFPHYY